MPGIYSLPRVVNTNNVYKHLAPKALLLKALLIYPAAIAGRYGLLTTYRSLFTILLLSVFPKA